MSHLLVIQPGPATTVQDAGRLGWQHLGVSPAGFADPLLAALGNALVGNPPDAAVLEWTLHGDTLRVIGGPIRVAVAAWADVAVDGAPAPQFRALQLHEGQVLTVGALTKGRHGVLAVAGGVQMPSVLGSRATHVRTGVGGGPLLDGDQLPVPPDPAPHHPALQLPVGRIPPLNHALRVLVAPQATLFQPTALPALRDHPWLVRAGDRMGTHFSGPPLLLLPNVEPVSEGVVTGALQVPPSAQPIALGPDRQTMGGYAKLAVVISADLRHLAQLRDGDQVRFLVVDHAAARAALLDAQAALRDLLASLRPAHDVLPFESPRLLRLLG